MTILSYERPITLQKASIIGPLHSVGTLPGRCFDLMIGVEGDCMTRRQSVCSLTIESMEKIPMRRVERNIKSQ